MSLERLNELKAMVSACIDDQYSRADLTRLINAEMSKSSRAGKCRLCRVSQATQDCNGGKFAKVWEMKNDPR